MLPSHFLNSYEIFVVLVQFKPNKNTLRFMIVSMFQTTLILLKIERAAPKNVHSANVTPLYVIMNKVHGDSNPKV